jgi:hypothetical protein
MIPREEGDPAEDPSLGLASQQLALPVEARP